MNKNICIIKSNAYGITLILDSSVSFEELITDVCQKFADSRDFFGAASLVLGLEGRTMSPEELEILVEAIELNSDIHIQLISENNKLTDFQTLEKMEEHQLENLYSHAKIIGDAIPKGESLSFEESVIVLGDVKPKATLVSRGSVICLGTVYGTVKAGYPSDTGAYVAYSNLDGGIIQIGSVSGTPDLKSRWLSRKSSESEAYGVICLDGKLIAEPLNRGILKQVIH